VIQPASPATGQSVFEQLITWAPIGLILGALGGVATVLFRARRDPRVRLRDEFADAVGSPVLASVQSRPARSVAGWSALLAAEQTSPVQAWAFRQVLRALAPVDVPGPMRNWDGRRTGRVDHPRSLTVVSLAGDVRGLAVGVQLAAFAASVGIVTRLLPAGADAGSAPLWVAYSADLRPGLLLADGMTVDGIPAGGFPDPDPAASSQVAGSCDLTIVLAVADRQEPTFADCPRTAVTLLAVAPGTATQEELARVAVAADDTDRRIDGIVVADPDGSDRTTGRRSLEARARQLALPVRLTGIGPVGLPAGQWGRGR
jgi:hypothetical protein